MAINCVEIKDFLVFKDEFSTDFCPGVNVLIGGNGTGKTTLMKVLYWACEFADKSIYEKHKKTIHLSKSSEYPYIIPFLPVDYFGRRNGTVLTDNSDEVISRLRVTEFTSSEIGPVLNVFVAKSLDKVLLPVEDIDSNREFYLWCNRELPSVFIPTTEMLSHSRGFLALNRERPVPFDKTEIDIIAKAELEPTHEITVNAAKVLEKIAEIIGGTVSYDGKDFFVEKTVNNNKIPFSFEASGYRRLGLLWKLLRNGLLEPGSILFWDEPENSLNPENISLLVDILLELSRNGVQIFIATHSEIFASYFAVNRKKEDRVMFISLYKEGEHIRANNDDRFDLLEPNNLTAEPVKLYEKEIEKGLGGNG
jgi:energy-coupling factor transporter ATP-binding protein EcfA2